MFSIWSLFSKKNKQVGQTNEPGTFKLQSKQDITTKKVTQTICDEVTEFYYSDFHDLKNNRFYDRFFAGEINLPTGQIVCTDPMYRALALPQSWTINQGQYPVYLYIGIEDDFAGMVTYAELVIKDEIPKYWEMSLISEELLDNFERKTNGMYPVENGLSCFADYETFKIYEEEIKDFYQLNKDGNYYIDILEKHFKSYEDISANPDGKDWANYKPVKANGNIIMFVSGYGDGLYARYVGYDKDGNIVRLVTDFVQLTETANQ